MVKFGLHEDIQSIDLKSNDLDHPWWKLPLSIMGLTALYHAIRFNYMKSSTLSEDNNRTSHAFILYPNFYYWGPC